MKISVAMIVKNEEERLPRCLPSLTGFDEIVICDTGSSDRTLEVARDLGAAIFETEPIVPFHFAEARNRALDRSTGDWVVSVDADEAMAPGSVQAVRDACERAEASGANGIRIWFVFDSGRSEYLRFVVWKRGAWRWKNRVHNELDPIEPPVVLDAPQARLVHFEPADKRRPWRAEQTFELLKISASEDGGHVRALRHLAQEHILRKEPQPAVRLLKKYIASTHEPDIERFHALLSLADAFTLLRRVEDALDCYRRAGELMPFRREPFFYAGLLLGHERRASEAAKFFERAALIPITEVPMGDWRRDGRAWSDLPERAVAWYKERGFMG